jgi:hypothetical protein
MHSLFSDVSVSLNEKLVSPSTSLYPDRAYIETLLSYGSAAKESQLTVQGLSAPNTHISINQYFIYFIQLVCVASE